MSTIPLVPEADTTCERGSPPAGRDAVPRTALTARDQPLPEFLPLAPPAEVVDAVRIPGPLAVLLAPLLWFLPKTMGPHLAARSWRAAIAACALWSTCGIGCIIISYEAPGSGIVPYVLGQTPLDEDWPGGPLGFWPEPSLTELLRSPFAMLATTIGREVHHGEDLVIGLCGVAAALGGLLVLAIAIMPYAAAGERWYRLLGRCIRLTLWSTTMLVPLGLMLQVSFLVSTRESNRELNDLGTVALFEAWFLWVWFRAGLRYAGPGEGPGWEPARPSCEGCGYALVGLTARQRCPECGRPVHESLPASRYPTLLDDARGFIAQLAAFLDTLIESLVSPSFFRHLAVRQGYAGARRFAVYLSAATAVALVTPALMTGLIPDIAFSSMAEAVAGWAAICMLVAAGTLLLLGLVVLAKAAYHRRPIQQETVITFHAAAWLLPFAPIAVLTARAVAASLDAPVPNPPPPPISLWYLGTIPWGLVEAFSWCLYPFIILAYGLIRSVQARRQTVNAAT